MKYTYTAVFTEENGKVFAKIPDLDGCITSGNSLDETIDLIEDALSAWLCTAEDENLEIPKPTPQRFVKHNADDVLSLLKVDTLKYRALTEPKAVRKNVSLPLWLSKIADTKRINCSQVLQDALIQRIGGIA